MREVLNWQKHMQRTHKIKFKDTTKLLNQVVKDWQRNYASMLFVECIKKDYERGKQVYDLRRFSKLGITEIEANEVIKLLLY